MIHQHLYSFVDQMGFEFVGFVLTLTLASILIGLASKSFLHD